MPTVLQSISLAKQKVGDKVEEHVAVRYQGEKDEQQTLWLTDSTYRSLVGTPTIIQVQPVLGDYKTWKIPFSFYSR